MVFGNMREALLSLHQDVKAVVSSIYRYDLCAHWWIWSYPRNLRLDPGAGFNRELLLSPCFYCHQCASLPNEPLCGRNPADDHQGCSSPRPQLVLLKFWNLQGSSVIISPCLILPTRPHTPSSVHNTAYRDLSQMISHDINLLTIGSRNSSAPCPVAFVAVRAAIDNDLKLHINANHLVHIGKQD